MHDAGQLLEIDLLLLLVDYGLMHKDVWGIDATARDVEPWQLAPRQSARAGARAEGIAHLFPARSTPAR
jgi:hypothetical protein